MGRAALADVSDDSPIHVVNDSAARGVLLTPGTIRRRPKCYPYACVVNRPLQPQGYLIEVCSVPASRRTFCLTASRPDYSNMGEVAREAGFDLDQEVWDGPLAQSAAR
jgi:hypothetical protein